MAIVDVGTTLSTPRLYPIEQRYDQREWIAREGGPDYVLDETPLGMMYFYAEQAIATKASTDVTHWLVTVELPSQFCYRLQDINVSIVSSGASNSFEALIPAEFVNAAPVVYANAPTPRYAMKSEGLALNWSPAGAGDGIQMYRLLNPPGYMLLPPEGEQTQIKLYITDNSGVGSPSMTGYVFVKLVYYGRGQASMPKLNTPQLVQTV